MHKTVLAVCVLLALGEAADAAPVLGLYEETANGDFGAPLATDIRIGFVKTATGWSAAACDARYMEGEKALRISCANLPEPPKAWTLYDRGRIAGTVQTSGWLDSEHYFHAGALKIVGGNLPPPGPRSRQYGGWTDKAMRLPLLALSTPLAAFAPRWRKDTVHPELRAEVWPLFRKAVPRVDVCEPRKFHGTVSHPRAARLPDMRSLGGWRSSSGEMLLKYSLDPKLGALCEMHDVKTLWFYREADGALRPLPSQSWEGLVNFSPVLTPLAFGDFDGDGGEEAVFQYAAYNDDGYILYYDHFRQFVRFGWTYQ
jgi:hypothetical protein